MKRYLLFCGDYYYPSGGWGDFRSDFDTIEDAVKEARRGEYVNSRETPVPWDWWHVVDRETGEEVAA